LLNHPPDGKISSTPAGIAMSVNLAPPTAAEVLSKAAPSKARGRNAAFDRARSFVILLVLIHHSVIPYTYYGHTDRQSFLGFDGLVTFNDSFMMVAMFLLSGLFTWPSLQRKGVAAFLRGRWLRLGLPFAVGATILMPIAYYAVALRNSGEGFGAYLVKTVTVGPWESGPIWFLAVLLAFDMLAVVVYRVAPGMVEAIGRLSIASCNRPALAFWALLAASVVVYVPLDLYFGIGRWFTLGPLAIQADRILLYALYFFVGVGIGSVPSHLGLLSEDGELARRWPAWLLATVVTFVGLIGLIYYKREFLGDPDNPPPWWDTAHAFFSASQTLNLLALFLKFESRGRSILDSLRESSFGIFLIHYLPLLWLQYALFGHALAPAMQETAILKALIVFVLTLAMSWAATGALRKIPGVAQVL
jgi:surface polysaccharide O-acyltransferase-like enzyme